VSTQTADSHTETQPVTGHTIANGVKAHVLTAEDRSKGARTSAENRRERAKSAGQRLREAVEKKEKALHAAMIEKAAEGNVQAYLAVMSYAYGTPAKVEPEEIDINMTSDQAPRGVSLDQLNALASTLGVTVDGEAKGSNTS
jgi:hypothetical protein